jgi:phosphohistidine phosphatase SixA
MLRHAQTEAGVGDPPNFRFDQCTTQRNLSREGRDQARQIGQWFKTHRLVPRSVQSSIWCRCKDTAELAFGTYRVLPALNSTFNDRGGQESQTRALRVLLKAVPQGQFDVWVTHQVNISALTGEGPAMGEAFVLGASGETLARTRFA